MLFYRMLPEETLGGKPAGRPSFIDGDQTAGGAILVGIRRIWLELTRLG
jgi:hypothetical protein